MRWTLGSATAAAHEDGDGHADYLADSVGLTGESEERFELVGGDLVAAETEAGVGYESALVAYAGEGVRYGLFATPDLTADDHEPSRPARAGPVDFLRTEAGRGLLAGLLGDAVEAAQWTTGPEPFLEGIEEHEPVLLEEEATMATLVGAIDQELAVLANVSRVVYEDDVVYAVDVHFDERVDEDQELLAADDEASFDLEAIPELREHHVDINFDVQPIDPYPETCYSPYPPFSSQIEIRDYSQHVSVHLGNGGAEIVQTGETLSIDDDGAPSVTLDVAGELTHDCDDYDRIEWTHDSNSCRYRDETVGHGLNASVEFEDCNCRWDGGTKHVLTVKVLDSRDRVLDSDILVIIVDLC